jgi:hypothetical protein
LSIYPDRPEETDLALPPGHPGRSSDSIKPCTRKTYIAIRVFILGGDTAGTVLDVRT